MTTQRHWYNDRELFLHGLVRSNYVTSITDWFMSFAGKWAELVLYGTVLYSCAELYPGVHLPVGLSLAVFLIQMGALDIGGLSLGKLAKQAREDGNMKGADQAATLSRWLIAIMLTGVATVGIEHVVPLPDQVRTGVEIVLVFARSICAVLYGRVVHELKQEIARTMIPVFDVAVHISEWHNELSTELSQRVTETERRLTELLQRTVAELSVHLTEQIERTASELPAATELISLAETVQAHTQTLTDLAALPNLFDSQLHVVMQEVKTALATSTEPKQVSAPHTTRPKFMVVEASNEHRTPNTSAKVAANGTRIEIDKGDFVRQCLTETPNIRNADIQRKAGELGITISAGYISDTRKAFEERSA
jgi:hypothetical protein